MKAVDGLELVLWDVDGTLAETERDGHRVAFNLAFERLGLPWRWDEAHYGRLLRISGGFERVLADLERREDAPRDPAGREALARTLHREKNAHYSALMAEGRIPLRAGVMELMEDCRQHGLRMGIATTSSRSNVEALLLANLGPGWRDAFAAVVCGEDVHLKKPDPEAYHRALEACGADAAKTVAIEDSPAGAESAIAAGVKVVVTRSEYFGEDPIAGALASGPGLHMRRGWMPAPRAAGPGDGRICLADVEAWFRP